MMNKNTTRLLAVVAILALGFIGVAANLDSQEVVAEAEHTYNINSEDDLKNYLPTINNDDGVVVINIKADFSADISGNLGTNGLFGFANTKATSITINGNNKTITATGTNSDNSEKSIFKFRSYSSNTKYYVNDLTVDAATSDGIKVSYAPFSVYGTGDDVTFTNVTAKNSLRAGINVGGGATLTLNGVTTSGNAVVGVRVGVINETTKSHLVVNSGTYSFSETVNVWVENPGYSDVTGDGAQNWVTATAAMTYSGTPVGQYKIYQASSSLSGTIQVPAEASGCKINVTLDGTTWSVPDALTIEENVTLTVPSGKTLTITGTLTVNGSISKEGSIVNNGTIGVKSWTELVNAGGYTNTKGTSKVILNDDIKFIGSANEDNRYFNDIIIDLNGHDLTYGKNYNGGSGFRFVINDSSIINTAKDTSTFYLHGYKSFIQVNRGVATLDGITVQKVSRASSATLFGLLYVSESGIGYEVKNCIFPHTVDYDSEHNCIIPYDIDNDNGTTSHSKSLLVVNELNTTTTQSTPLTIVLKNNKYYEDYDGDSDEGLVNIQSTAYGDRSRIIDSDKEISVYIMCYDQIVKIPTFKNEPASKIQFWESKTYAKLTGDLSIASAIVVKSGQLILDNGMFALNEGVTIKTAGTLTINESGCAVINGITNNHTITNNGVIVSTGSITGTEPTGKVLKVTIDPADAGSISATVSGTKVTATATAGTGHVFSYWTDGTTKDASASKEFTVSGTVSTTAKFDICTVTFVTNGGSDIDPVEVAYGGTVAKPSDPTREGYAFKGWYSDEALTEKYDFATTVTEAFSLYAKWEETSATLYTVTFMDGSSVYYAAKVKDGNMVSKPIDPTTTEQKRFAGWVTESGGSTKYVFTTPVTSDLTLYASWNQYATLSIPKDVEKFVIYEGSTGTTEAESSSEVPAGSTYTFRVVTVGDYVLNGVWSNEDEIEATAGVYTVTMSTNIAITVEVKLGTVTTTTTEDSIENDDGSVTTVTTETTSDSSTSTSTIKETSSTEKDGDVTESAVEATIDDSAISMNITTQSNEEAVITQTMAIAITDVLETATEAVPLVVDVETPKVTIPSELLTSEKISEITVSVNNGSDNSARITIPASALSSEAIADSVSISVTTSSSAASSSKIGASSAVQAFDLTLVGSDTTVFDSPVSVSYDVDLPTGAKNVRAYCIDSNEFVKASYRNGTASFSVPHFSAWTIVYDKPVVIVEDDDDILFILEQQKNAQEAASSQTTTEDNSGEEAAIIIAAAAVAGAMLACAFFAFRRN